MTVQGFPYSFYVAEIPDIEGATRRRREDAAVAQLVVEAFGAGAVRRNNALGAPLIEKDGKVLDTALSLSHCRTHALLALAPAGVELGVDIEEDRPQLQRVLPRVLSARELEVYASTPLGRLKAWTMKEALYKAARCAVGKELDFIGNIHLPLEPGALARVSAGPEEWLYKVAFTTVGTALAAFVWRLA